MNSEISDLFKGSSICRAPIDNLVALAMTSLIWGKKDIVTFKFVSYFINRRTTIYDLGSNDRKTVNIDLPVEGTTQEMADKLYAEVSKITAPESPQYVSIVPPDAGLDPDYDTVTVKVDPCEFEIAISNKVVVKRPNGSVTNYRLGFVDYKSQDLEAVQLAQKRDPRFTEFTSMLLKTGNSFHGYSAMNYDDSLQSTAQILAITMLTQRDVIDQNWALLSILRDEAFLRVSQNYKGPIELVSKSGECYFNKHNDNGLVVGGPITVSSTILF